MEDEERFTYFIHPSLFTSEKEPQKAGIKNKYGFAFSKQMDNNKSFAFMDDNQAQELDLQEMRLIQDRNFQNLSR